MSKHKRKHTNRQKPMLATDSTPSPRPPMQNPVVLAHEQLDAWIRGEIGGENDPAYNDHVDAAGFGVINLGKMQRTMVLAREFYKEHKDIWTAHKALYQSDHAGRRPEPRKSPAAGAAATMENGRGEWVPAIPLPFYGSKKGCSCGKTFWRQRNYEAHYAYEHIVLGTQPL